MHPDTITRVWAGGEHPFLLDIDHLRAIERQCGAGIEPIYLRILGQQATVDDIVAPIRLGLIGGGMSEREARDAVSRALAVKRPFALRGLAFELLVTFWIGPEDDSPGESSAGEGTPRTRETLSPADAPDGATSSPAAR